MTYGRWLAGRQNVKRALDAAGQPILKVRCPHKYNGEIHGDRGLLVHYEQDANYKPCDWTDCPKGKDYQLRVQSRLTTKGK